MAFLVAISSSRARQIKYIINVQTQKTIKRIKRNM